MLRHGRTEAIGASESQALGCWFDASSLKPQTHNTKTTRSLLVTNGDHGSLQEVNT